MKKIKDAKTLYNTIRYNYLFRMKSKVKPSDTGLLYDVLDKYKKYNTVFAHIGLSQLKNAYQVDSYDFVMEALTKRFSSIIAPGFTPSFKKTSLYHKKYSKPEYGVFSSLFLNDCSYRTNDPVYSLLVYGDYSFRNLYTEESFGDESCFAQMDRDNILCVNIGTKWPVSSQKHFIEYQNKVPYIKTTKYSGVIYYDEVNYDTISVVNYTNNHWLNRIVAVFWNNYKLSRHMYKEKLIDIYNLDGVRVYAFRLGDLRVFLEKKLKKDPFYLIT